MMLVIDLAHRAYDAAKSGDLDGAEDVVMDIEDRGPAAINAAMLTWVDRTMRTMGARHGQPVPFALHADDTDEVADVDRIDPEIAWSGRMFAARAAGDRVMWRGLIAGLPPGALGSYAFVLLTTMTATANAAEDDIEPRTCCPIHHWITCDPAATSARQAVAHLN
jgi:hypothetical protein